MVKMVARSIMAFCDFMNGYIGQEIQNAVISGLMMAPVLYLMLLMMIVWSR